MSLFEWAVSSIVGGSSNTAGAIDIIAIRRSDGSISCSPFHVKLGKAPKKGERKVVTLKVNGKDVSVNMKLGQAGEAFFVERTRNTKNLSFWTSPPLSPSGANSFENCAAAFPLTSPLYFNKTASLINSNSSNLPGAVPVSSISVKVEPSSSSSGALSALQARHRSYSESDLVERVSDPSVHPAATTASTATAVVDSTVTAASAAESVSIDSVAVNNSSTAMEGSSMLVSSDAVTYRRDRSMSDMSNVSSLPPLYSLSSANASVIGATATTTAAELEGKVPSTAAAPGVSWIWSWGALPKKSKSNKSLTELANNNSKSHIAEAKSAGGVERAAPHPSSVLSSLELRPTADDDYEEAVRRRHAAAAAAYESPPRSSSAALSVLQSRGSRGSSSGAERVTRHEDDSTVFMVSPDRKILNSATRPPSATATSATATSAAAPAAVSSESKIVGIKPLSSILEDFDAANALNNNNNNNNNSNNNSSNHDDNLKVAVLSAEHSEAKPPRANASAVSEFREADPDEEAATALHEEEEDDKDNRVAAVHEDHYEEDEDDENFLIAASQNRLLSLCGHILSGDVSAPEPVPVSAKDLRKVLFSYRMVGHDLSSVSVKAEESLLVVTIDDYLLTIEVAEKLVLLCGASSEKADMSLTDEMVQLVCSESQPLPAWVGARISLWGTSTSLRGSAAADDDTASLLQHQHHLSPFSTSSHQHSLGNRQFVTWSSDHMGWRESFSDLVQAFKHSSSHSNLNNNLSSGNIGGAAAASHSDFLKAYMATTPSTTGASSAPNSFVRSSGRRLSDPLSSNGTATTTTTTTRSEGLTAHLDAESDYFIPSHSQDDSDHSCNNSTRLSNDLTAAALTNNLSSASGGFDGSLNHNLNSLLSPLQEVEEELEASSTPLLLVKSASLTSLNAVEAVTPSNVMNNEAATTTTNTANIPTITTTTTVATSAAAAAAAAGLVPVFKGTVSVSDLPPYVPVDRQTQEGDTDNDHNSLQDTSSLNNKEEQDTLSLEDIDIDDICPEPAGGDFYDSDTDSYLSYDDSDNGSRGRTPRGAATTAGTAAAGAGGNKANSNASSAGASVRVSAEETRQSKKYRYRKVLVPSQEQLEQLQLQDGENEITFSVDGCAPLKAQLFVWPENAKIVVTDIEGIILSKTANKIPWVSFLGGVNSKNITNHSCNSLLNALVNNNYRVLYVTQSTPLVSSKEYLASLTSSANVKCPLKIPNGPIFKSPDSLIRAFGAERTDVFKAAALRGIKNLFPSNHNPYHACFATRQCDVNAFARFGFPEGRIFLVDDKGDLHTAHRLKKMTFQDCVELVNEMFPYVADPARVLRSSSVLPALTPPLLLTSASSSVVVSPSTAAAPQASSSSSRGDAALVPALSLTPPPTPSVVTNNTSSFSVVPSATTTASVVNTTTAEDTYNDFNFWRMPLPVLDD